MDSISRAWNSIDSLTSINFWAQVILAFMVLGTFCFTAISVVVGWRREALQKIDSQKKDQALAEINRVAAEANSKSEALRHQNLKLELAVEGERAARIAMQRKLADREVNAQQRADLLRTLSLRPGSKILVDSILADGSEARRYAQSIAEIFKDAGWEVNKPMGLKAFSLAVTGGLVTRGTSSIAAKNAAFVLTALKAANLDLFEENVDDKAPPDEVMILIGGK